MSRPAHTSPIVEVPDGQRVRICILAVLIPLLTKRKTIPTLFKIGEGQFAYLQAGMSYRRT